MRGFVVPCDFGAYVLVFEWSNFKGKEGSRFSLFSNISHFNVIIILLAKKG